VDGQRPSGKSFGISKQEVWEAYLKVRANKGAPGADGCTSQPWVILYVKRWLAAPILMPDGSLAGRDRGTPQGSAVSPVLANHHLRVVVPTVIKSCPSAQRSG
jgi:hypothetical protein